MVFLLDCGPNAEQDGLSHDDTAKSTDHTGVWAYLDRHVPGRYVRYGYGKMALRDGLELLRSTGLAAGTTVLLPALVPSAVIEPIKESGLEHQFYGVTPALEADISSIESSIDEETIAIISVDYFGFSQSMHDELRQLADGTGAALIEDNAHSPLSTTPSGELLGTRGELGFTSFHKLFSVPDGAALFVQDGIGDSFEFPRSSVSSHFSRSDALFGLRTVTERMLPSDAHGDNRPSTSHRDGDSGAERDLFGRDPSAIYDRSKRPMSKLTSLILSRIDPDSVVRQRRNAYLERVRALEHVDGVRPVYEELPSGTCPQCVPVRLDEEELNDSTLAGVGSNWSVWPSLSHEVINSTEFESTRRIAERLRLLRL